MYDLIIRHGTIIDGSGKARYTGDIAIENEKIVAVGTVTGDATETIDATGLLVTPGWVDVHTHYDGQATWDPILAPSSWHGVTTVVMGNCGVGFAPVRPGDEQYLIELMEGVEDIPGSALAEGIDWNWESFPEYLDALETKERTIDIAAQVPHGAIRAYVMGERCNTQEDLPTEAELSEMQALVREGIKAGAVGFSSSRTWLHKDKYGVHVPGTFAGSDEMLSLGLAMKGLDHGIFEMVSDHLGDDDEWTWIEQFAAETGRPITLVATSAAAFEGNKMYNIAESARCKGIEVRPQIAGRPTGVLHGLHSNFHVFSFAPSFKEVAQLPLVELVAKLQDPDRKAAILSQVERDRPMALSGSLSDLLWHVFPLGDKPNYEPNREESVAGIAEAHDEDPFSVMYDLLLRHEGKELFYQPLGGYQEYTFDFFKKSMEHPNVLFGLSDGGAHCGVIADAGMPSFIIGYWARDRKKGEQLDLEFLVKKLSRDTAVAFGMEDRGLLQAGYLADINVIDFNALQLHRPEAIFDLPAGGKRLVQRVNGYRHIIKRGQPIFRDNEHTGALPGKLVRGGALA
ncbi:MAG: amidohydrolase family protein [Pseudomonadota bacterium]|nr:amidohydrolase family protein [Pseudomonadota bacterium]